MSYTIRTYAPGSSDTVSKIMFALKTQLLIAGWQCVMSSDADGSRATHDVIASANEVYKPDAPSGPGDSLGIQAPYTTNAGSVVHNPGSIDNPGAWFVLEQPGVKGRQVCVQRTTARTFGYDTSSNPGFRVKYSPGGLFDFATSTTTITPYASDELVLTSGTDTDAAPSFATMFGGRNNNSAVHIVTGGAAEDYPFVLAVFANATGQTPSGGTMQGGSKIQTLFFLDIARALPDGSVDPLDPDPAVIGLEDSQVAGREGFVTFYPGTPYASLGRPADGNTATTSGTFTQPDGNTPGTVTVPTTWQSVGDSVTLKDGSTLIGHYHIATVGSGTVTLDALLYNGDKTSGYTTSAALTMRRFQAYAQVNGAQIGDLLPAGMTDDGNPIVISPVPWARGGAGTPYPKGFKGYSTLFYYSAIFAAPMTLFTVGDASRMAVGFTSIPWDGSTPISAPTPASFVGAFVSPFTPPADALEDFDPNPDALSVDAGLDAGRIVPLAADIGLPFEGTHVVCLGHDRSGFRGWLNPGDFVEVSQAANFGSDNAVTFTPRFRPPAHTPDGYAWKASVHIDGIEQSHRLFHGRGVEDLSTWTLNVSKLSTIDHRLSFRLTLIATG